MRLCFLSLHHPGEKEQGFIYKQIPGFSSVIFKIPKRHVLRHVFFFCRTRQYLTHRSKTNCFVEFFAPSEFLKCRKINSLFFEEKVKKTKVKTFSPRILKIG
jgi:hypothetical protein